MYITCRKSPAETLKFFEGHYCYNLWQRKQWPFRDLEQDDILYWYNSLTRRITWKLRVRTIERFQYTDKREVKRRLESTFGHFESEPYFTSACSNGYCLAWKATVLEPVNLLRPEGVRLPQIGWVKTTDINEIWPLLPEKKAA